MDAGFLFESVLRGVLGSRPKRSRRALRYLTGTRGNLWSNPTTLLTAAGVAWGVYETLNQGGSRAAPVPAVPSGAGSGVPPRPVVSPPPLPGSQSDLGVSAAISDEALMLVRLAISAAHADGAMSDVERAAIVRKAAEAGVQTVVETELRSTQPLADIVAGVSDVAERATLYVLAYTVIRADEHVTGAERIYLAQLANLLDLDRETVEDLERQAGDRIDALGDQGQLGG